MCLASLQPLKVLNLRLSLLRFEPLPSLRLTSLIYFCQVSERLLKSRVPGEDHLQIFIQRYWSGNKFNPCGLPMKIVNQWRILGLNLPSNPHRPICCPISFLNILKFVLDYYCIWLATKINHFSLRMDLLKSHYCWNWHVFSLKFQYFLSSVNIDFFVSNILFFVFLK